MNSSYNEREVLALLQDEGTQKRGFEMIVAQYSEQLYWQIRRMVLSHEDANDLLLGFDDNNPRIITDFCRLQAKTLTCINYGNYVTTQVDDPQYLVRRTGNRSNFGIT